MNTHDTIKGDIILAMTGKEFVAHVRETIEPHFASELQTALTS